MKIKSLFLTIAVACSTAVVADEGMWLLPRIKQQNEAKMKQLGLQLPADEVADKLSKAIIHFNGNGTASFVSKDGLILTNHHCARSGIQKASTEQHNYLRDGFWAADRSRELPMPGLTMVINKAVSDVSAEVNKALKASRQANAYKTITAMANNYAKKYPGCKTRIRSYLNNTLHILYATQTITDLRLVGVAPYQIAKFGGETDNWTWPRHGCDFAILRAYVAPDGKPADYSSRNVPLRPEAWLNVSTEGVGEGDFAMSIGFPGHTDRRATSMQVWEWRNVNNPPLVKVRTARQQVLEKYMNGSEALHIKYADKFASSANYCKNYGGMNEWIDRLDLCRLKADGEKAFVASMADAAERQKYAKLFADIETGIRDAAPSRKAVQYYLEVFGNGIDMMSFVTAFGRSMKTIDRNSYITNTRMHYRDYDEQVDRDVAKALLKILVADLAADQLCPSLRPLKSGGDAAVDQYVDRLYDNSVFANEARILKAVGNAAFNLDADPAYKLSKELEATRKELSQQENAKRGVAQKAIGAYYRAHDRNSRDAYYPDADGSMRLSYGSVCTLPVDGQVKPWQTRLSGVMEKAKGSDNPDYRLPERLGRLWQQKDFGQWDAGGDVPTCFITNGDVTGGNSGSPMINARGELVGLVFDCNWESMLRDFHFDKSLHRVICLDARYLMFIAEKYGNARWIVDEMTR